MYTEMLFPEYGVHFIAVNDGVDSVRLGQQNLPPSATYSMKCTPRTPARKSGQRGNPKDAPRTPHHYPALWVQERPGEQEAVVVDEEAAAVVQKIFALCMDGMGPTQIAKWLQENKVLSPVAYCYENDLPTTSKRPTDPYKWATKTVVHILERLDYLGHTVNFKLPKHLSRARKY